MELISVIVPAYNAGKKIKACIESTLKQTYKDFELIIVNDGSTDNTRKVCEIAAEADDRIILINKENGGVSSARNAGLEAAKGDYIVFIDADDTVTETYLENLYSMKQPEGLAIAGYRIILPFSLTEYHQPKEKNVIPINDIGSFFSDLCDESNVMYTPVSKLYSRAVLSNGEFDTSISIGEDLLFNLEYLRKCSYISTIPTSDYNYIFTDISASKRPHDNDLEMQLRLFGALWDFGKDHNVQGYEHIASNSLCGGGFRAIENLIYSSLPKKESGARIKKWLACKEFMYACKHCGSISGSTKVFCRVCSTRSAGLVRCFFVTKNFLKKLYYSLRKRH